MTGFEFIVFVSITATAFLLVVLVDWICFLGRRN
jgi:hypothetical protein